MSNFADLANAARLTELEDLVELLKADKEALESELDEVEAERDSALSDVTDVEREIERLDDLITNTIESLRVLPEVTLSLLEESIQDIALALIER